MGWRHGRLIRDSCSKSLYDSRREARKAFLALSHNDDRPQLADSEFDKSESETVTEWSAAAGDHVVQTSQSMPAFVRNPKQEMHGLGYDPFKRAPEFRERKRLQTSGNKDPLHRRAGKVAPGFGIGAMEELDVGDEDIYASGFEFEEAYVDEDEEPSRLNKDRKQLLRQLRREIQVSGAIPISVASDGLVKPRRAKRPKEAKVQLPTKKASKSKKSKGGGEDLNKQIPGAK